MKNEAGASKVTSLPIQQRQSDRTRRQFENSLKDVLINHKEVLDNHETRIARIETAQEAISNLAGIAEDTLRYVKKAAPIIGTALVASGVASGKFGAFLGALVKASTGM